MLYNLFAWLSAAGLVPRLQIVAIPILRLLGMMSGDAGRYTRRSISSVDDAQVYDGINYGPQNLTFIPALLTARPMIDAAPGPSSALAVPATTTTFTVVDALPESIANNSISVYVAAPVQTAVDVLPVAILLFLVGALCFLVGVLLLVGRRMYKRKTRTKSLVCGSVIDANDSKMSFVSCLLQSVASACPPTIAHQSAVARVKQLSAINDTLFCKLLLLHLAHAHLASVRTACQRKVDRLTARVCELTAYARKSDETNAALAHKLGARDKALAAVHIEQKRVIKQHHRTVFALAASRALVKLVEAEGKAALQMAEKEAQDARALVQERDRELEAMAEKYRELQRHAVKREKALERDVSQAQQDSRALAVKLEDAHRERAVVKEHHVEQQQVVNAVRAKLAAVESSLVEERQAHAATRKSHDVELASVRSDLAEFKSAVVLATSKLNDRDSSLRQLENKHAVDIAALQRTHASEREQIRQDALAAVTKLESAHADERIELQAANNKLDDALKIVSRADTAIHIELYEARYALWDAEDKISELEATNCKTNAALESANWAITEMHKELYDTRYALWDAGDRIADLEASRGDGSTLCEEQAPVVVKKEEADSARTCDRDLSYATHDTPETETSNLTQLDSSASLCTFTTACSSASLPMFASASHEDLSVLLSLAISLLSPSTPESIDIDNDQPPVVPSTIIDIDQPAMVSSTITDNDQPPVVSSSDAHRHGGAAIEVSQPSLQSPKILPEVQPYTELDPFNDPLCVIPVCRPSASLPDFAFHKPSRDRDFYYDPLRPSHSVAADMELLAMGRDKAAGAPIGDYLARLLVDRRRRRAQAQRSPRRAECAAVSLPVRGCECLSVCSRCRVAKA